MEVVKERRRLRERAIKESSDWASGLPFKATAILAGSYAKGDFNIWSDVDVLLISEELKGSPVERLKALDMPPGYQVLPLTPEEFKRLLQRKDRLALEAMEFGIVLRDDLRLIR